MLTFAIAVPIIFYPIYKYIVVPLIFYPIYKFLIWPFNLEQKYGFSGPPPTLIIGHFLRYLKKGFHVCDPEDQKKYGHIYPTYIGRIPTLVVSDQNMLRQILVKDSKSFIDRPKYFGASKLMRRNLFQSYGKDWKRIRSLATPAFTSRKVKMMSPLIVTSIDYMMDRLKSMDKSEINIKDVIGSLTMDVATKTMFGIQLNKSSDNVFVTNAKLNFKITLRYPLLLLTILFPIVNPIVEWLFPRGITSSKSLEFFEKFLTKVINMRKNDTESHNDFLSLMFTAHEELRISPSSEISNGLTEEEMMAQSIFFLLAGYEATASVLSFCSYYLALNQDTQEEVYQELQENLPTDETITYDMLANLNLLECCLLETLRICPLAVRLERRCVNDCALETSTGQILNIEKGLNIAIPVYAIHHDETLWPEPDKFDIHRFDSEERKNRGQFTFLPFGTGPRMCVGQKFALLEAKLTLAYFLKKYRLLPCEKTPTKLTFGLSILTKVLEPVIVRLEER